MTWPDFYLLCFLVGFLLSAAALIMGMIHIHIPGMGDPYDVEFPHMHHGHAHAGHAGAAHGDGDVSVFNFATVSAFLAWFGGAGYLMNRFYSPLAIVGLGAATLSGLAGGAAMFFFIGKVLVSREENLDPADYDMVGTLGTVSDPILEHGTGEMIYSRAGVRRPVAIRSESGEPVERGAEVVVTRYEDGVAWVRRWDELTKEF